MSRILVAGGTGALGRAVVEKLKPTGRHTANPYWHIAWADYLRENFHTAP